MGSLIVGKAIRRVLLLIASGLVLAGCMRGPQVAYYGSREAVPLPAARSEQVLIARVETAAETTARNAALAPAPVPAPTASNGLFALPRSGPDSIEAYLSGQAAMPLRTAA